MPVRINGLNTGSVTLSASANGGDVTLNLPNSNGTVATTSYADSAPGLQYITGQSFNSVSAVNVNGCFTSTYENYRIVISSLTASTGSQELNMRMRVSASDNTAASYETKAQAVTATTSAAYRSNGGTSFVLGPLETGYAFAYTVDLQAPQLAENTNGSFMSTGRNNTPSAQGQFGSLAHLSSTVFDGFSFYSSSGTVTGKVRVYGYRSS